MTVSRVQTNLHRLMAVCTLLIPTGFACFAATRTSSQQTGSEHANEALGDPTCIRRG